MSAVVPSPGVEAALPRAAVNAKLVSLVLAFSVGVGVFLSGFVIREPAPYELFMAVVIAVWGLFALRISRVVAPLLVLIVFFNIGGVIAMTQMSDLYETPLYLAVTLFLGLTSVFLAAVVEERPNLLNVAFNAWTLAAFLTSVAGITGYFGLVPGAEIFTRYGRATGVFEDPNVFGPFLVLPAIWLTYTVLTGRPATVLTALPILFVIVVGIFLSFSRGAWGLIAICGLMLVAALAIQIPERQFRLRLIVLGFSAFAVLAVGIFAILQIPDVQALFSERAQLVQEYDEGRYGRFARFGIGMQMAMENPLGIGALEFGRLWGEDTHNIWLKALLDYSWLGFASFAILTCWTMAAGFRILFRPRPWQPLLLCAYVVFAGHILLATIIDIDHWRHFYLLIGLVWGCVGLEWRYQRTMSMRGFVAVNPVDQRAEKPIVRAGSERSAAR